MQVQLWAPPQLSSIDVAMKANEWIEKHPDMPPFPRFLQDYVSSAWPSLWQAKIPYLVSIVKDCVIPIESEQQKTFDICAICHNDLSCGVEVLSCKHAFHTMCIHQWLRQKQTCPVCRAIVNG